MQALFLSSQVIKPLVSELLLSGLLVISLLVFGEISPTPLWDTGLNELKPNPES